MLRHHQVELIESWTMEQAAFKIAKGPRSGRRERRGIQKQDAARLDSATRKADQLATELNNLRSP